jgi:PAS domain S-box-containing protein
MRAAVTRRLDESAPARSLALLGCGMGVALALTLLQAGRGVQAIVLAVVATASLVALLLEEWARRSRLAASRDLTEVTEALAYTEARYRVLAENSTDLISVVDLEGVITYASPACRTLLGYSPEELIGRAARDFVHPDDIADLDAAQAVLLESPELVTTAPYRSTRKDDTMVWLESTVRQVVDPQTGEVAELQASVREVTKRREAEEALRESHQLLQGVIDNTTAFIYVKDRDFRYMLVNTKFEQFFHRSREDLLGRKDDDLLPPGIVESVRANDRRVLERGEVLQAEEEVPRDGEPRTYLSVKFPLLDSDGIPFAMCGISTDITERKRAEEAVRAREEHFRQTLETANEAYVAIDDSGVLTAWNPQAEVTFGWSEDEALGRRVSNMIVPPRFREAYSQGLSQFLSTGKGPMLNRRIETTGLHRDGHEFPIELTISAVRVGETYEFNAFLHDISARKRAEKLLQAQYAVTRVLAESTTVDDALPRLLQAISENLDWELGAYWVMDEREGVLRCTHLWSVESRSFARFEEVSRQTTFSPGSGVVGEVWRTGQPAWHEDIRGEPTFRRAEVADQHRLRGAICLPVKTGPNVLGVIEFFSQELKPPDPELLEMTETVTGQIGQFIERRRAEQALREVEEGFRRAFDDSPIGMALVGVDRDKRGRLIQVNRALSELTGRSEDDLLESALRDLTHPEDADRELPFMEQLLAGEIPSYRLEQRYLRADERPAWVLLNASAVHDRSGKLLYALVQVQDMTEHKQAEQRLAKAAEALRNRATELERSNADLQQFAYVASHDLTEPLRMVSSYVQLLARRYRGRLDSDADEFIRFAVEGASRMQALIDGLLLYSRAGTLEYTHGPVDCSKVMVSTLSTMDRRVNSTGAIVTVDPLPTVTGDETQVGQLFQNLLSNALKFVSDRQPRVHVSAVRDGPGWLFSVTDNGIGIEPRHTERIFKVFQRLHNHEAYTGSGIGLAICKRIVERHGGRIWADPVPGGGTRFSFTIPDRGPTADETTGPSHER